VGILIRGSKRSKSYQPKLFSVPHRARFASLKRNAKLWQMTAWKSSWLECYYHDNYPLFINS